MRLWTVQPIAWWQALSERGRIRGVWSRAEPQFLPAYRWMASQMLARGMPLGRASPTWCWHSCGAPGCKPDMRTWRERTPVVRIELEVPDHLALLSDYDTWHSVLNRAYIALDADEHERVERLSAAGRLSAANVQKTWPRIFDVARKSDFIGSDYIQACVPRVELDWVRCVERFKPARSATPSRRRSSPRSRRRS